MRLGMTPFRNIITASFITYDWVSFLNSASVNRVPAVNRIKPVQKIPNIDKTILVCFKYVRSFALSLQWPGDAQNHFLVKVSKCIVKLSHHDVFVEGGFLSYQMIYLAV